MINIITVTIPIAIVTRTIIIVIIVIIVSLLELAALCLEEQSIQSSLLLSDNCSPLSLHHIIKLQNMISGMPKNKKQDPDFKPGATNNTYRSTYNKDTRSTAAQLQGIFSLRCELRTHMGNVTKRVLHVLCRSVYTAVWTRNEMCRDFFAKTSLTFLTS